MFRTISCSARTKTEGARLRPTNKARRQLTAHQPAEMRWHANAAAPRLSAKRPTTIRANRTSRKRNDAGRKIADSASRMCFSIHAAVPTGDARRFTRASKLKPDRRTISAKRSGAAPARQIPSRPDDRARVRLGHVVAAIDRLARKNNRASRTAPPPGR